MGKAAVRRAKLREWKKAEKARKKLKKRNKREANGQRSKF